MYVNLIVYCDFKFFNILVIVEGEVKLLDFGIVKLFDVDEGEFLVYLFIEVCVFILYYVVFE